MLRVDDLSCDEREVVLLAITEFRQRIAQVRRDQEPEQPPGAVMDSRKIPVQSGPWSYVDAIRAVQEARIAYQNHHGCSESETSRPCRIALRRALQSCRTAALSNPLCLHSFIPILADFSPMPCIVKLLIDSHWNSAWFLVYERRFDTSASAAPLSIEESEWICNNFICVAKSLFSHLQRLTKFIKDDGSTAAGGGGGIPPPRGNKRHRGERFNERNGPDDERNPFVAALTSVLVLVDASVPDHDGEAEGRSCPRSRWASQTLVNVLDCGAALAYASDVIAPRLPAAARTCFDNAGDCTASAPVWLRTWVPMGADSVWPERFAILLFCAALQAAANSPSLSSAPAMTLLMTPRSQEILLRVAANCERCSLLNLQRHLRCLEEVCSRASESL